MLQFLQKIDENDGELNCYKQIYSTYGIQFIKTIRSDRRDYHDELIEAITGGPKKPLRRRKTFKDRYKVGIRDQQVTILKWNSDDWLVNFYHRNFQ